MTTSPEDAWAGPAGPALTANVAAAATAPATRRRARIPMVRSLSGPAPWPPLRSFRRTARPDLAPRDVTATAQARTSPQPCNPEAPRASLWHQITTNPPEHGRPAMTSPAPPRANDPVRPFRIVRKA